MIAFCSRLLGAVASHSMPHLLSALLIISLAWCPAPSTAQDTTLTVGSKKFTENVILGAMATQLLQAEGFRATHREELGGSRFLWEALVRGDIDVYPEYTGTLIQEILASDDVTRANLRRVLADYDVRMTAPLGFNNTYALGMQKAQADSLGIRTISDLREHPDLRFGFSNEFMDRGDGWPALQQAYTLPQTDVRGIDHDLGYRGLASDAVDVIDLYSTDAEIEAYDLRVLRDDRDFFPTYRALFLYRADLTKRAPGAVDALRRLEDRIPAATMTALNKRAKIDGQGEAEVAAAFLNDTLDLAQQITVETERRPERVWLRTQEHVVLVGVSLLLAILVAVPLGVVAFKTGWIGQGVLLVVGITYTIPSLALLAMMVPPLGLGRVPAITALFFYSLLPIVWNTYTGLNDIERPLTESALALGLSEGARLRLVELPLAARSILAGIKIAAVINVGTATLGALIGAGGYGQPILTGIRRADLGLILEGTVPAAVLTVLLLALFEGIEHALLPRESEPAGG